MKILSILIVFLTLSLASCKKDYTCSCINKTTTVGSTTTSVTTTDIIFVKAKKADARRACVKTTDRKGDETTVHDCKLK